MLSATSKQDQTHNTCSLSTQCLISLSFADVIMGTVPSQITSLTIVYSTVYSDADQRKYRSSTSLAFVRGNHRRPVNSPHKWPVTREMFPFDDVIMIMAHYHKAILSYPVSLWTNYHGGLWLTEILQYLQCLSKKIVQSCSKPPTSSWC